jgi:hypothetical protein
MILFLSVLITVSCSSDIDDINETKVSITEEDENFNDEEDTKAPITDDEEMDEDEEQTISGPGHDVTGRRQ